MSENVVTAAAVGAGGFVAAKIFGPVLSSFGEDINKIYIAGRDRILSVASKKIDDIEDGKKTNIRAAREVLWNGVHTENSICDEYFGGLLASSRSENGENDDVINYIDLVKSLSSRQLELHYLIYGAFQNLLISEKQPINISSGTTLSEYSIYIGTVELFQRKLPFDRDLTVLYQKGVIGRYEQNVQLTPDKSKGFMYIEVYPTMYGIMLYAAAHNKLENWRSFQHEIFESVNNIEKLKFYSHNLQELSKFHGL